MTCGTGVPPGETQARRLCHSILLGTLSLKELSVSIERGLLKKCDRLAKRRKTHPRPTNRPRPPRLLAAEKIE